MTRFFPTITTIFAGLALSLSLLQAGSAQAGIFDFDIKWTDNTTTKGWLELDDSPESQYQYNYSGYSYTTQYWDQTSLLDASFTHEGTSYDKSAVTSLGLQHYDFPDGSYYQPYYGKFLSYLNLSFGNQYLYGSDSDAGSQSYSNDYGYKYNTTGWWTYTGSATSVSIVERSAKAVPEPVTLAGLALVGAGLVASRRKHLRKTAV